MSTVLIYTHTGGVQRELKRLLGKEVEIAKTENGAPYLVHDEHYISLSHKDNVLVIAVSTAPVGVDIERLEYKPSHDCIARRYFEDEAPQGDSHAFFRAWTRREAYGKWLGVGLNKTVMFTPMAADYLTIEGKPWWFAEDTSCDGYLATVLSCDEHVEIVSKGENRYE